MTLGDGSVPASQEGGDRATNDIATTEDDCMTSRDGNACVVKKLDDARRGTGREERFACTRGQMTDIVCVKSGFKR